MNSNIENFSADERLHRTCDPWGCCADFSGTHQRLRFRLLLTLTVAWMIVIFAFSAQPAKESTDTSMFWGRVAGEIFVPGFKNWPEDKQNRFAEQMDYPVRKTAHATEYAVLGFLLFSTLYPIDVKRTRARLNPAAEREAFGKNARFFALRKKRRHIRSRTGASFLLGALYAASDEFHQLFVPGRSGQFTDVLIDSGGVIAGILLALLFRRLTRFLNPE
uniref:VanZ family protein n=1 Tax=Eubacterium cellulosolvens TaxID=29322 RepID=UPI000684DEA4|nr:VanZ family protein [[Eubacterium] cellulosolvens]